MNVYYLKQKDFDLFLKSLVVIGSATLKHTLKLMLPLVAQSEVEFFCSYAFLGVSSVKYLQGSTHTLCAHTTGRYALPFFFIEDRL